MAEARLHPRLRLNVRADVIGSEVLLGREVADISLGGIRFLGPGWEAVGAKLELVLTFVDSGEASVHIVGEVVRSGDRDMGIRFFEPSDEQKWALRKYVRKQG